MELIKMELILENLQVIEIPASCVESYSIKGGIDKMRVKIKLKNLKKLVYKSICKPDMTAVERLMLKKDITHVCIHTKDYLDTLSLQINWSDKKYHENANQKVKKIDDTLEIVC